MAKHSLEFRRGVKAAKRAKKNITGGLSGNARDRRQQRRTPKGVAWRFKNAVR